jgi:hypothetical protein
MNEGIPVDHCHQTKPRGHKSDYFLFEYSIHNKKSTTIHRHKGNPPKKRMGNFQSILKCKNHLEIGRMPLSKIIGVLTKKGQIVVQTMPGRSRSLNSIRKQSIAPRTANLVGLKMVDKEGSKKKQYVKMAN